MEKLDKKPIAILNLAGELSAELAIYFKTKNIKCIDPMVTTEVFEWTHILTKDILEFNLIRETYQTLENDVQIISLSGLSDLQNFIFCNGKLIFDEIWLKGEMGKFILDKFLQEYAGMNLEDNYPSFKEQGSFQITNPFNTGEYLDRLVYQAFSNGMSGLSIKTYFDHLVMFLSGLKAKGKLGLPIEVTYGLFNDIYGVQLHFFAQDLMLDDITSCLSSAISKRPEEYFLNIAVQSSDFFDFTFLRDVRKAVITGIWTKDERVKFENRGLMFTSLSAAANLTNFPIEGITSFLTENIQPKDFTDKVNLPSSTDQSESEVKIAGDLFSEAVAEKIASTMEVETVKQIISGNFEEEIFNQLVKGTGLMEQGPPQVVKGATEDDVKIRIGSEDVIDELVNIVKGKIEEEEDVFFISGSKSADIDKFAYKITSSLSDSIKGDDKLKMKIFNKNLPESIKSGFFDFALKLNKSVDQLDSSDLEKFKNFEVKKIIKAHTQLEEPKLTALMKNELAESKMFFNDFKKQLETSLKEQFNVESVTGLLSTLNTAKDDSKVKNVVKETLQKTIDEKFHLSANNKITTDEQEVLVKALSTSLNENEEKIRTIIIDKKEETRTDGPTPMFKQEPSALDRRLEERVATYKAENDKLKLKVQTVLAELKASKDARAQLSLIQKKASEAAEKTEIPSDIDEDDSLRNHFKDKLNKQNNLSQQDAKKLSELLERESKLLANVKNEEIKAKKAQIESNQREAFFSQELEKQQRLLKARDLIINKSKESFLKIQEKKDHEYKILQMKLDQVNKVLASNQSQGQGQMVKDLERQNLNMTKMVEVYKNKLSSLATNMQSQKHHSDDSGAKEEVRRLQMQNNQYKNQFDATRKDLARLQEKTSSDQALILSLKSDKAKLEQLVKKAAIDVNIRPEISSSNAIQEQEMKRIQSEMLGLEAQYKDSQAKTKELEAKLAEALKMPKRETAAGDDNSKVKVTQLENSLKKLTQDLVESRNQMTEMKKETNKLRQEKTALQNQLDKVKKDMDKGKTATPKRPPGGGTGGKAA